LKPHERIWLEEIQTRLALGKPVDYPEMMVTLRDKLPKGFTPNQIDPWYLHGAEITVAGLHALDPNTQVLKDLERLLLKVQAWLIENPHRQEVTAEICAAQLGESPKYIARLLALAGTLGSFWSSGQGVPNSYEPGFSRVEFTSLDAIATVLEFTSIENSLRELEHRRQSGPQDSWWGSTSSSTSDFENDPTEGDNSPFNAEEQVRVKLAVEEIRVYIRSTYSLPSEPLAKVNRKLDYLIDASTRIGRKDWTIMCVGILVSLAIPQLTPSGPGVRELFAVAWNLVRHVLGGVISPPLLH
jgi:hypothetical protein